MIWVMMTECNVAAERHLAVMSLIFPLTPSAQAFAYFSKKLSMRFKAMLHYLT